MKSFGNLEVLCMGLMNADDIPCCLASMHSDSRPCYVSPMEKCKHRHEHLHNRAMLVKTEVPCAEVLEHKSILSGESVYLDGLLVAAFEYQRTEVVTLYDLASCLYIMQIVVRD